MKKDSLTTFLKGLLMGVADLIPGVSGGTIAFITGIYDRLMKSLSSLTKKTSRSEKRTSLYFLATLLLGMGTSIASLSIPFHSWLQSPLESSFLYALFFGLIAGSISPIKEAINWKEKLSIPLFFIGLVGMIYFCATTNTPHYTQTVPISQEVLQKFQDHTIFNIDTTNHLLKLTKEQKLHFEHQIKHNSSQTDFFILFLHNFKYTALGFIASGAMLLPGISGSFVLLVLGYYTTILRSLSQWTQGIISLQFQIEPFFVLIYFLLGVVLGLSLLSKIISYVLSHFRSIALSFLLGLMCGGFYLLWPFWTTSYQLIPYKQEFQLELLRLYPQLPSMNMVTLGIIATTSAGFLIAKLLHKKGKLN